MKTLGDDLLDSLDELKIQLDKTLEALNNSGVERTRGLRDTMGRDCTYYKKSMDIFLKTDYMTLKSMVESLVVKFNRVEGKK